MVELGELLAQLMMIIVAAKLCGTIASRFGQPSVLGEIIAGILIGPAVFGLVHTNGHDVLHLLSEIGVIFLMFFAGVETNLKDLTSSMKSALTVAVFGVILPFIGGYIVGVSFGMDSLHAIFLGIVLTATSVSISVQTFRELHYMSTREGATVLGAAIADDIIGLIILAIMISMTVGSGNPLSLIVLKQVIFFVVIIAMHKLLPLLTKIIIRMPIPDMAIFYGVILCFLYSWFAEFMGISNIIGAFFAGLALANNDLLRENLEGKLLPSVNVIFIPIFFASIGLAVSLDGLAEHLLLIIVLSIVAVATKVIGAGFGARITGFNMSSSLIIGTAMISRGEVALITSSIGLAAGLFSQEYYTPMVIAIVVSTLVTPPMLKVLISKQQAT